MVLKVVPPGASGAQPDAADLLVVTHGPERGREPGFLRPLLAKLAERRPDLSAQARVWASGSAFPDLSGVGLVLFALQPTAERDAPDCWAEARRIALRADLRWIPTLNAPVAGAPKRPMEAFDSRRGQPPGSLLARLHHRKRAFVLGGEVVNGELLASLTPSYDPAASIFAKAPRLPARLARFAGQSARLREEALAADCDFFEAAPEATRALAAAAAGAGLDFASVEYVAGPDGPLRVLSVEPIGDLAEGTLGLLSRRRGGARRVDRVLDRFAEAVAEAHARELATPFKATAA